MDKLLFGAAYYAEYMPYDRLVLPCLYSASEDATRACNREACGFFPKIVNIISFT